MRVINTDNGAVQVWSSAPYRVLAVDARDVNGPTPVEDQRVSVPAGGRYDLEVTAPARVQVGIDRAGPRRRPRRPCQPQPPRATSTCCRTASPRRCRSTPPRPIARSATPWAGARASSTASRGSGGPSTATCGRTCRCTSSTRATSWSWRSRTTAARCTRCTCTATTRSCSPATASPRRAARGGSTRSTSRTTRPWRSRSSPTTPASGWTTATTSSTPREGLVAHLMYSGVTVPYRLGDDSGNEPE